MSYLEQLARAPVYSPGGTTEANVAPPTLVGRSGYPTPVLATLRKTQLLNVCRAWRRMSARLEAMDHQMLVQHMFNWECEGLFDTAPLEPWYLRQSSYTSDEIMDGKIRGFTERGTGGPVRTKVAIAALMPWDGGPVGSGAAEPVATSGNGHTPAAPTVQKRVTDDAVTRLRGEMRELGLNSFGKSRKAMLQLIEAERRRRGMVSGGDVPPTA